MKARVRGGQRRSNLRDGWRAEGIDKRSGFEGSSTQNAKQAHNQNIILRQTYKVQKGGVRDKHHIPSSEWRGAIKGWPTPPVR